MRIELLYFDGCPSWKIADDRLRQVLTELGRDGAGVERHQVETPEQAEELGFTGSPTIRIDGVDPFANGREQIGLACRIYDTPTGLRGIPDTGQLREVLS